MEIWILLFFESLDTLAIGAYTSYELAIIAMNQHSKVNGFNNLDKIDRYLGGATCWCDEGRYEISCHAINSMPEEW